jgi:hypothetical protein
MKKGRIFNEGVFGPIILNSKSTLNTESENIYMLTMIPVARVRYYTQII